MFLSALAGAPLGWAQEVGEEDQPSGEDLGGIEEIVVTAERREQALQDVPVSVTALSGFELDAAGIETVEDLALQVPNTQYGVTGTGSAIFTIRGVSTGGGDANTAFHVDGVYQNSAQIPAALSFFDLQRVEVLRGPQGTLYGRNATGGAINVISVPPSFEFETFGDVAFGTYDLLRTRAVVNVPVVEDTLALRASFLYEDHDGYQINQVNHVRNQDADDEGITALRGQIRWTPRDDMDLIVRTNWVKESEVGYAQKILGEFPTIVPGFNFDIGGSIETILIDMYANATPNPENPRHINLDVIGTREVELHAFNAEYSWDIEGAPLIGDARLNVIGAYQWSNGFSRADQDLTDAPLAFTEIPAKGRQWVAEVHLASAGAGAFEWIAGLFYLGVEDKSTTTATTAIPLDLVVLPPALSGLQFCPVVPVPPGAPPGSTAISCAGGFADAPVFNLQRDNADSLAVFGETSYTPPDRESLKFTLGLRFTADWKRQRFFSDAIVANLENVPPPANLLTIPVQAEVDDLDSDSWTALTGKVGIDWFWGEDDNLVYWSASRGYKAGTIETAVAISESSTVEVPNASPESIWAVEVGSKNRFLDNRLQANFAAFYYDYDDLQITDIIVSQLVTQNAARARMFGVEAELEWLPLDDLSLKLNLGYLNTKITDGILKLPESPTLEEEDISGNRMPRAPVWTLTFIADYRLDLGRFGTIIPRVQVYASSDIFYRAFNLESDKQDGYTKTDLRLTWLSASRRYSLEGWVDNIEDDDVTNTKVVGSRLLGAPIQTVLNSPRTAGIRVGVRW